MHVDEKLTNETFPAEPEKATLEGKNKFVGFWLFLGGETVLFASLFGTYLALKNSTNGGPTSQEMFQMPLVFIMTMLLLTSSLTSVYAMYHMKNFNFKKMQLWLLVTVLLGLGFLGFEIYEFYHYAHEFKHTMRSSAFGSAFYALVGTHGLHVLFGLCWILTLIFRNAKRGLNLYNAPKFYVASIYWHFIDVVWVFIFTVVYLMGMVG
ncbi:MULTISPECIES: cytochrome c oxidase subunit III [Bacillus]|jgi:cytochrome c oxidase subunit 3|uniref:Cytochrome B oxidoreductase n=11 Tax=Bacillus cereus group TaxID=86661 RepID=A0A1T3VAV5_BACAN|nr:MULTISPECIES: cytochrome c oxidase subunit III [Bacillus]EDX55525.1 cytochrome c oxidase, subunit III [Bacillus cereus W]EDX68964.1 cytochrome c oxidase, subunit III [Bacillus cereus NVH0597-99]EEL44148.1 Cytochrome c oxidase subunit 3 [Bacillus cereus Rock3-42]EJT18627.1 cytochrome c oxidase subunit III [Bacillus anthracis str. UR-1]MDR4320540.1 cytochrome c oxidase subunit III [Bacillus paranthracis]COE21973.1 Cytochrome c oxidase subunit 3 [Streptococcus pneumoniae]CUB52908.1 Cytochrom